MTAGTSAEARPPVLAGAWYPGRREELAAAVDRYIAQVPRSTLPGDVVALIAPHAGYVYSAQVAANAYAQIKGGSYRTVVLIGPAHRATGKFATPAYSFMQTPLGDIEVDAALVSELGKRVPLDRITVEQEEGENSLEIQLPFLQRTLGAFSVLPIMMGYPLAERFARQGWQACQELSTALVDILAGRNDVLLVASTDLSHLPRYDVVVRYDEVFRKLAGEFDGQRLSEALLAGECHACGGAAVVTVMLAAKERGADAATVLAYANSGDITGERIGRPYIVGYTAVAITQRAGL